jgi:hypothetical protein
MLAARQSKSAQTGHLGFGPSKMGSPHFPECGQLGYNMLTNGTDRWEICRWDPAVRRGPVMPPGMRFRSRLRLVDSAPALDARAPAEQAHASPDRTVVVTASTNYAAQHLTAAVTSQARVHSQELAGSSAMGTRHHSGSSK